MEKGEISVTSDPLLRSKCRERSYLEGVLRHEFGRKTARIYCKAGYRILKVYGASLPDSNIGA